LSEHTLAEIAARFLAAETRSQSCSGQKDHATFAGTRLEHHDYLGVSGQKPGEVGAKNHEVSRMKTIELFAGAGGLALGTANAGFEHDAVLEWDHDACDTIRENQRRGVQPVASWPLHEVDVRKFDFRPLAGVELVAGGPPCQPFSIGGKHRGPSDQRNLFPEVVRAVRETRPKAILIENVRGLLRPAFAKFFEYVILQLSFPEVVRKTDETWLAHLCRLERHQTRGTQRGLLYNVVFQSLNAADYGAPQKRYRVFIVGFRSDLHMPWSFPAPTHSCDALVYSQFVTGEYWERHKVAARQRPAPPERLLSRIDALRSTLFPPSEAPWVTVRDALSGLPEPSSSAAKSILNHKLNPGARVYPGHTGSPLDQPAKALKAGDHGVPGGENMLAYPSGEVRYFTVRESARLQTFPDNYSFRGSWSEAMRQLGNAVPVCLAEAVAKSVSTRLA
jgi:DNA (cytosine-5)-methyltransferase 1